MICHTVSKILCWMNDQKIRNGNKFKFQKQIFNLSKYSDLPNNHAANYFGKKNHLHNLIWTYVHVYYFLRFFLQNLIFTYINEKKNPSYTALLRPTRLLISEKSNTYTIKWSYTIIWQVRVQWVHTALFSCTT